MADNTLFLHSEIAPCDCLPTYLRLLLLLLLLPAVIIVFEGRAAAAAMVAVMVVAPTRHGSRFVPSH